MFKLYEIQNLSDGDDLCSICDRLIEGEKLSVINKDLKANYWYKGEAPKLKDLKKSFDDLGSAGEAADEIVSKYYDDNYADDEYFIGADLAADGEGDGLLFFGCGSVDEYSDDYTWAIAIDDYYGAPADSEDPINDGDSVSYAVLAVKVAD